MIESEPTILIVADTLSPRLTYALDFIFSSRGQPYNLILFKDYNDEKISIAYCKHQIDKAKLSIKPVGLLFENKIENNWKLKFDSEKSNWKINDEADDLAVIFYCLSRYEEYIDQSRDEYGRFTAQQSVFLKENQLHLPWCDILVKQIWESLGLDIIRLTDQYRTILTYDIDIAWAYKHKPKWRSIASSIKALAKPGEFSERRKVSSGKIPDPYDSYHLIEKNADRHPSMLFFLLGDYGQLDKNHHWKNKALQNLINLFKTKAELGIHPSFNSFLNRKKIEKECNRLANISNLSVTNSRQHYLRFTLPRSYQLLQNAGITHDYTMGFAEHYGFRAGTSFPFLFFDLSKNKIGNLTIVPFSVMDGTLKEYMKLSPEEGIKVISDLKTVIKSVGGQFIPLWHNHSIGDQKEWKGWQIVYSECLK